MHSHLRYIALWLGLITCRRDSVWYRKKANVEAREYVHAKALTNGDMRQPHRRHSFTHPQASIYSQLLNTCFRSLDGRSRMGNNERISVYLLMCPPIYGAAAIAILLADGLLSKRSFVSSFTIPCNAELYL